MLSGWCRLTWCRLAAPCAGVCPLHPTTHPAATHTRARTHTHTHTHCGTPLSYVPPPLPPCLPACLPTWARTVQLHPEADSLIRALLTQDPAMRLGSRGVYELQAHPFFASVNWSTLEADAARDRELAEAAVVAASRRLLMRDANGGNGTGNDSSGRGSSSGTYGAFVAQRRLDTGERWEPRRTRARWC
jgi:hypothetical protein